MNGHKDVLSMYVEENESAKFWLSDITKKWTGHRQDWGQIHSQLEIYFEEQLENRMF